VKNEKWDMAKDSSGNGEEDTRLFMSKGRLIQPKKLPIPQSINFIEEVFREQLQPSR
jgi:hypothetical protein